MKQEEKEKYFGSLRQLPCIFSLRWFLVERPADEKENDWMTEVVLFLHVQWGGKELIGCQWQIVRKTTLLSLRVASGSKTK